MNKPILEIKGLKTHFFTYNGVVRAVDGIDLTVNRNEVVGIVGETGCGKSVTVRSTMGLVPEPRGEVSGETFFDGRDLQKLEGEELRRIRGAEIAMVFQEPMTSLNPVLAIGTQLREGMVQHLGLTTRQADKRAVELLRMVGISEAERRLKQYPHHFSGGMRQRVMIATAISCEPKLIIADEPTTALDVTIQAQILDLMKVLSERLGAAMILITHNLGIVARYTSRVNVMYAGRIVESASTEEIFVRPSHPYTQGLLASVPRIDKPRSEALIPIQGQPPDLARLTPGCAFAPRCPIAEERCVQAPPPLDLIAKDHRAACIEAERQPL